MRQFIEARGKVAEALVDGLLADNLEHAEQAVEEGDRDEFKKEAYRVLMHRGATVATDKEEVPHTVAAASSSSAIPALAIAEMPRKRAGLPRPLGDGDPDIFWGRTLLPRAVDCSFSKYEVLHNMW